MPTPTIIYPFVVVVLIIHQVQLVWPACTWSSYQQPHSQRKMALTSPQPSIPNSSSIVPNSYQWNLMGPSLINAAIIEYKHTFVFFSMRLSQP